MSYVAPTIGSSGLVIPSFQDILALYTSGFQGIYGSTVYLGNDSADFQLLSIIALSAADCNAALQLAYNNFSPAFAVGAGLSALVAINGLKRKLATPSTCQVVLVGTAGAVITNGIIADINGNLWNLPASVTIGGGGTVTATATAQQAGAINITAPSQLTTIVTPTAGWTSVNNNANVAVVGQPVETDSQLRQRQLASVALPAISPVAGTQAAVLAVAGVTRAVVVDNPTGATDALGNPEHSVTCVVENGATADIALAIYLKKTIGCLSNGTTSFTVADPVTGNTEVISFDRPTVVPIFVTVNAHPQAGGTLSAAQILLIQNALVAYLNSLPIGSVVSFGELAQTAASAVNASATTPIISIRTPLNFGRTVTPVTSTDVALAFNEAASGVLGNIVVNSV